MSEGRVSLSAEEMRGPVDPTPNAVSRLRPLPLGAVRFRDGFWAARRAVNAAVTIPLGWRRLEESGVLANFRDVAAGDGGEHRGKVFSDSDLYKWLEAASWQLSIAADPALSDMVGRGIRLIGDAQDADGYVDTHYQRRPRSERFTDLAAGHELYCIGHLIQAAVAHRRATGGTVLLEIARRAADHVAGVFGEGRRDGVPGHPEIESALVELWRETGERRYLELAAFFVDRRGRGSLGPGRYEGAAYLQDHVPVREATTLEGHAVRQMYLLAGVADVYMETGDETLLRSSLAQWHDLVTRKLAVTGGLGAHHYGESFGEPYDLPNASAYDETCAAIGSVLWNWRLLLATGESRHADLMEWTLYNAVLPGVSLSGDAFFYVNPLAGTGKPAAIGRKVAERAAWFATACCPPNVMRLLASLHHYVATVDGAGLQIHQYAAMSIRVPSGEAAGARVEVDTEFPWDGRATVRVAETAAREWTLTLRVPAWAPGADVAVNGEAAGGAVEEGRIRLRRTWRPGDVVTVTLPVRARRIEASPRVDAARGSVCVHRGPLLYCFEAVDLPAGVDLLDCELAPGDGTVERGAPPPLDGVVLEAEGFVRDAGDRPLYGPAGAGAADHRRPTRLVAVPYFAWANRGPSAMRVWIPTVPAGLGQRSP